MKSDRLVVSLLVLVAVFQGASLYKQWTAPPVLPGQRPGQQQARIVQDAPKGTQIDLKGLPVEGKADAKVVLVEFSDYQCPFCIRYATQVADDLKERFVQSGQLKHAFVNNPLPIHENARMFAAAAICAGYEQHFWEMHDRLFKTEPKSKQDVLALASSVGVNNKTFGQCLDHSKDTESQIESDIKVSRALNLRGTPAFALGKLDSEGRVIIDKLIMGSQPLNIFEREIEAELSKS